MEPAGEESGQRTRDELSPLFTICQAQVIQRLVERHKTDPTVWGVTPVNEPWQHIPLEWLKDFYWRAYNLVRKQVHALTHTSRAP